MRIALLAMVTMVFAGAACAQSGSRDAAAVQDARNKSAAAFGKKKYYEPDAVKLDDLPRYEPREKVSGTIRIWGSDLFGGPVLRAGLEDGFRKFHPDARFEFNLKGPAIATAGMLTGQADIAPTRRFTWDALLAFQRIHNHDPLVIRAMTGWAVDSPFVIAVNKDNPIAHLTMKQLDGIFGAERDGGWIGTSWHPELSRGPEGNIRTWGQLGLGGEWKDKPIHVNGYGLRYLFSPRFSDDVLQASDKWNETLKQYVNYATPDGQLKSADQQMAEAVARDRYGIAYYAYGRGSDPNVKVLAIAPGDGSAFVAPTVESVRDHSYPLTDSMFVYVNREPGKPLDPKVREFLRFLLSREGQEIVARDTTMLPLTAELAREELKKLD
jgi:phosphate transport system substrate-binding protein